MANSAPGRTARLTRPQHERIFALLRLIRERRFPNASTFTRELEVDRRTILRDLDYLRDRMGMPIEYDPVERGYHLTEHPGDIPLLEMREGDLLWLFAGQHLLAQAADDELAARIRESFRRISDLFGSTVSVRWDQLTPLLTAKTAGLGAAELRTFSTISRGLARRLEIRFNYRKTARAPVERRRVWPLHGAFVNGQWYLFAHDLARKATRSFVLSRMSKVVVTRSRFDPSGLPAAPDLLGRGFGVKWSLRKPARVRIRVNSEIAHLIQERKWHPSQEITQAGEGGLFLDMKVNTFRELSNWICSWGPRMEVLSPPALRRQVAKSLRDAAALYTAGDRSPRGGR